MEELTAQAQAITERLKADEIEVPADREIIAMIAYLQRLGTDIKVKPEETTNPQQVQRHD
jgi:cytochrome c oxidase cbb3-type subunit I/II